jgi:hypothetical protein
MKFTGNWKGKGEIILLDLTNNKTKSLCFSINMEIIKESDDIYILRGNVIDVNDKNNIITFNIIGYYNPNTKCIETSEKSGDGITTTFIKNKKLYHRASIANQSNISSAASFKLYKIKMK